MKILTVLIELFYYNQISLWKAVWRYLMNE